MIKKIAKFIEILDFFIFECDLDLDEFIIMWIVKEIKEAYGESFYDF